MLNEIIKQQYSTHLRFLTSGQSGIHCARKPPVMSGIPGVKNHTAYARAKPIRSPVCGRWFLTFYKKNPLQGIIAILIIFYFMGYLGVLFGWWDPFYDETKVERFMYFNGEFYKVLGWYIPERTTYGEVHWMKQEADIRFLSKSATKVILDIEVTPFGDEKDLDLYLNNNFIGNYKVDKKKVVSLTELDIIKGENILVLKVKEKCNKGSLRNKCINLGVSDLKIYS